MEGSLSLSHVIAPSFYDLHHELKNRMYGEYWLRGGRGSGKSSFISEEIVLGMLDDIEANAVVFRRYQNELRDTVYGQFEWAVNKLGIGHLVRFQISPMQIIFIETGQRIVFRGADNPRKLRSVNLGRGYIKYAWFEECDQFAGMYEIRNVLQSVFRGSDQHRVAFYSYNPPKSGRSWINQEVKQPKPGRRVHSTSYITMPREWLGERFLAEAEHLKKVNDMAYRHEYLGEEVGTGLEIFNNVTIEPLADAQVMSFDRSCQGLDFGYAVDPLCFEQVSFDAKRRRLYFIDEIKGLNLFNREFFDKVKAKQYHMLQTIADSAEPKSIDELKSFGMRIRGAKKGPGSVEFGIKWLQELEQIIIDPERCPLAAKEFVNYALDVDKAGEVKSRFPDKDNHAIDATRYALEDDMQRKVIDTSSAAVLRTAKIFR